MVKRYRVTLSCEERIELEGISNDGACVLRGSQRP